MGIATNDNLFQLIATMAHSLLLRIPTNYGVSWEEVATNFEMRKTFQLIHVAITAIAGKNPVLQDYIARTSYHGWRATSSATNPRDSMQSVAPASVETRIGYLEEVIAQLGKNPFAVCILKSAFLCNRVLLDLLLNSYCVLHIVKLLKQRGPSMPLLELLASSVSSRWTSLSRR